MAAEEQWLIDNGFEETDPGFRWMRKEELGLTVMKGDGGWCAIAFHAGSGASAMAVFKDLKEAVVEALKALKRETVHVEALTDAQLGVFLNGISYQDMGKIKEGMDGR
ncbi:MAG: hypothetical protein J6Y62_04550 [Clostridia bacterium]|nr:hypothetical protein [Clostridia bacterium]